MLSSIVGTVLYNCGECLSFDSKKRYDYRQGNLATCFSSDLMIWEGHYIAVTDASGDEKTNNTGTV